MTDFTSPASAPAPAPGKRTESVVPAARSSAQPEPSEASHWQLVLMRFWRHRPAVAALLVLCALYSMAAAAPFLAPYPPDERHLQFAYAPPQHVGFGLRQGFYTYPLVRHVDPVTFHKSYSEGDTPVPLHLLHHGQSYSLLGLFQTDLHLLGVDVPAAGAAIAESAVDTGAPTRAALQPTFFLLGADRYGRDLFSRILYGARVSLSIGLVGVLTTFLLGLALGGISGYVGGLWDSLIQRGMEIVQSFPQIPLWIALAASMPESWSSLQVYFCITLLLSLLNWTSLARVVRGKILALREEEYAVAARLMGASHTRILLRHLLPGFTSHVIVALTLAVPTMILGETTLSFLGLGLRPPIVSWGVLLQDCLDVQAVRFYPWLLFPVVFIVTTVLSYNSLGDGVRDAADPYMD